jgi:predicted dehydrogenase
VDRVGLGVVGLGNIAALNVAGYLEHPACDVVAVCDPRIERAEAAARRWGVPRFYADLEALLADPGVDAVEILTPTYLHREHVLAAVAAGRHVSCQKPLATSVADAQEMARAAAAAGVVLRVTECFAHYPPLERARALIRGGAIGRPLFVRIKTVVGQTDSAFQRDLDADGYTWRFDERSPGGHLFDDMVHKYAMATWLVDTDVVSVQAVMRRRDLFFEPLAATFAYDDPDLIGTMEVVYAKEMELRSRYYGADEFFEVQGEEGFVWVTRATGELLDLPPVMLYRDRTMHGFTDLDADWGAGFRRSSAHFVDALLAGTTPDLTPEAAVKVLQLCFAVYRAADEGRPVDPRTITDQWVPSGWVRPPGGA